MIRIPEDGILYHGSYTEVAQIDLSLCRYGLDFGKGFYLTSSPERAASYSDVGLRNARLNFRQQEENHIMENLIFNELRLREFDVDVGIVTVNSRDEDGKSKRTQHEVDFVANRGSQRYYIQSAFAIPDEQKRAQETASLTGIGDSFRKIVVVRENITPWHDENGILYVGIEDFLLDDRAMDL